VKEEWVRIGRSWAGCLLGRRAYGLGHRRGRRRKEACTFRRAGWAERGEEKASGSEGKFLFFFF
jgi:hypothetical protein